MLYSERRKRPFGRKEVQTMRGYFTAGGYYGMVDGRYVLFASESDYYEAMEEE